MRRDVLGDKALIKGFMVPIYDRTDPVTGRVLHGLGPEDYGKVRDGYGCPACLAEFVTYLVRCPACGWVRDVAADFAAAPGLWQQSIREREGDTTPYFKPSKNPFDEMMGVLAEDPDVDHVALSELSRKSRVRRS